VKALRLFDSSGQAKLRVTPQHGVIAELLYRQAGLQGTAGLLELTSNGLTVKAPRKFICKPPGIRGKINLLLTKNSNI